MASATTRERGGLGAVGAGLTTAAWNVAAVAVALGFWHVASVLVASPFFPGPLKVVEAFFSRL